MPFRRLPKADVDHRLSRLIDKHAGSAIMGAASWLRALMGRRGREITGPVRRILLIKFHGIGNIVMLLPSIRAVKEAYPGAEVDFLTLRTNEGILTGTSELDRVHCLDGANTTRFFLTLARVFPKLRLRNYDLVIDFEQFARISAIIAAAARARNRVGFELLDQRREGLFTLSVPYREHAHMSRIFMRLAEAAGAQFAERPRHIELSPPDVAQAASVEAKAGIAPGDVVVVMHPGSGGNLPLRRWPPEKFGALARLLREKLGAKVVISGGPQEAAIAQEVVRASGDAAFDATGLLSVKGLAALCGRAEVVVSNDTSTVHLASAMNTPVVGLYGPNTPFLYGPVGEDDLLFYKELECSPCLTNASLKLSNCQDPRCMEAIGVDEVFEGIRAKYFSQAGKILPRFKKERPTAPPQPGTP